MFDSLRLYELPGMRRNMLRASSSTRPTIWIVEENGVRAVIKDFSANRFLFRNSVGRLLIWREARAYKRLQGMRGVPSLYRVIDGLALVTEYIPGRSLENLEKAMRLPDSFFEGMKDLVDCIHERGLAHCDLKRAANTLLGNDGLPYIVDWAASISEREFGFPPLNLVYKRFLLDDHMAVIKLKLRHTPETVRPDEQDRYEYRGSVEIIIRAIRDRLREFLQRTA